MDALKVEHLELDGTALHEMERSATRHVALGARPRSSSSNEPIAAAPIRPAEFGTHMETAEPDIEAEHARGLPSREKESALAQALERAELALWLSLFSAPQLNAEFIRRVRALLPNEPGTLEAKDALNADCTAHCVTSGDWRCSAEDFARFARGASLVDKCVHLAEGMLKALARAPSATDTPSVCAAAQAAHEAIKTYFACRNRFVIHYAPLVSSIARRQTFDRAALDDAMQDGALGLMRAVERFDIKYGVRFSTYATWWIRSTITTGLIDATSLVRAPPALSRLDRCVKRVISSALAQTGCAPSTLELAEAAAVPESKILALQWLPSTHLILDGMGDASQTALVERLADPHHTPAVEILVKASWLQDVQTAMTCLTPREDELLRARFGIGIPKQSLGQLAERHGVSRERIRQVQEEAISKLRRHVASANWEKRDARPKLS